MTECYNPPFSVPGHISTDDIVGTAIKAQNTMALFT